MNKITVEFDDGFKTDITKSGNGPAIIIQHGWTGSTTDWKPIINKLKKNFTCYFWNCRSYHQQGVTIDRLATDVKNLIAAEELTNVTLVGHSMGALISWEFINLFGCDDLRLLVIVDQTPKLITDDSWDLGLYRSYSEKENLTFENGLKSDFVTTVGELYLSSQKMTAGEKEKTRNSVFMRERIKRLQEYDAQAWLDTWHSLSRKDFRPVLSKITVPTYLAYGAKSNFYGIDVANYVHSHIKDSKLHVYAESGHHPHGDYSSDFAEKIIEYSGC